MEKQGYVDLGRVKYQPRGGLDWCERHLGAEQPAVSDSGLTTRFDKYTYGQPDILSPVPEHVDGGAGDVRAEGLGVAGIMLLETNQKIQTRNKMVCS